MDVKVVLDEMDMINFFLGLSPDDKIIMLEKLTEYTEYSLIPSNELEDLLIATNVL